MAFSLLITLGFVCCIGAAAAAVVSSPDAQSGTSSLSLDGSLSPSSSNSSSFSSSSSSVVTNTSTDTPSTPPPPIIITTTASPIVTASGVFGQTSDTSPSAFATSNVQDQASVPYDLKSMSNPYFVSFLKDFAIQSGQTVQDLQATAITDPQIDIMWDVYVQTFGGGATLPSLGGSSSSGPSYTATSGSSVPQYDTGSQQSGTSSVPVVNGNWFQSFFREPSQPATSSQTGGSYAQYGSTQSQYGSSPSSGAGSMDQVFSFFRSPSSSQQQQYGQHSQQNTMQGSGMTSMNMAQSLMSMMSPGLTQPSQSGSQQYSTQRVQSGQPGTMPDSGWNVKTTSQQQQPAPRSPGDSLNNATVEQLTQELMRLLGKLPSTPPPTSNASSVTPSTTPSPPLQTQPPSTNTPAPSDTLSQSQKQMQTGIDALFGPQMANAPTNQMQSSSGFGSMSSLMNFGGPRSGLGLPGGPGPRSMAAGMNMLGPFSPLAHIYNARYNAKASRDLGCRTLGEMLDMDVPRAMDLTCHRSCAAIMPGAFVGKRFLLTCHCCPRYVSDHAIGMRSMYRRAEALT